MKIFVKTNDDNKKLYEFKNNWKFGFLEFYFNDRRQKWIVRINVWEQDIDKSVKLILVKRKELDDKTKALQFFNMLKKKILKFK